MALHRAKRVSESTWKKVFRHDSFHQEKKRCHYCKTLLDYKQATADHRIPKSKNGKTIRENIVVSCEECNKTKRSMSEQQFLSLIKKPPVAGTDINIARAWMRRKIALQTIRSCRNIERLFGLEEL